MLVAPIEQFERQRFHLGSNHFQENKHVLRANIGSILFTLSNHSTSENLFCSLRNEKYKITYVKCIHAHLLHI